MKLTGKMTKMEIVDKELEILSMQIQLRAHAYGAPATLAMRKRNLKLLQQKKELRDQGITK